MGGNRQTAVLVGQNRILVRLVLLVILEILPLVGQLLVPIRHGLCIGIQKRRAQVIAENTVAKSGVIDPRAALPHLALPLVLQVVLEFHAEMLQAAFKLVAAPRLFPAHLQLLELVRRKIVVFGPLFAAAVQAGKLFGGKAPLAGSLDFFVGGEPADCFELRLFFRRGTGEDFHGLPPRRHGNGVARGNLLIGPIPARSRHDPSRYGPSRHGRAAGNQFIAPVHFVGLCTRCPL